MPNEQNLEKGLSTQFRSGEEAARNGQKGGIASGAARRRKRSLKEAADLFLSLPVADTKTSDIMGAMGLDEGDRDNQMAVIVALQLKAMKGDSKAARLLFELLGDDNKPEEEPDDGFLEALNGSAGEDWNEEVGIPV